MTKLEFNFDEERFNKLFPFFILINPLLQIEGFGKSLAKVYPSLKIADNFYDIFKIHKPFLENSSFQNMVDILDQLIIIKCINESISLRGQFELVNGNLLFVGSPWFISMKQVTEKNLIINDFALNDPLLDLLHVLNNQENISQELKELLTTINHQKNKLKEANKVIHDIALFPTQNPDPLIRIDFDGNLLQRNPAAERLSLFTYQNEVYNAHDFFKQIINEIDANKERFIFETRIDDKDFSFVCKSLNEERYINIYGRDVTDQKKDQAEMQRLSLVASSNQNGIVFTNASGEIFWCNESYLNKTGYTREEVIGKTPIQVGQSEFTNLDTLKKMARHFFKGEVFDLELIHGRKDGSYFWTKTKGQPIVDSGGKILQYFAMIEDITEKKEAEFRTIESENRLAFLILNLQTGIVLEDENRKVVLVNRKFCAMFDFDGDPESLIGHDFSKSVQDSKHFFKDPEKYVKRLNAILKSKKAIYNEEVHLVDGRILERSYIPVFRDGIYKGNLRSYVDITLKRRYEDSITIEKEKYRNIIANMNLGLIEVDLNDCITLTNQSFHDLSGYTAEDLIGKKASDLLLNHESKEIFDSKKEIRKEGIADSYEVKIFNKKGEKRQWLVSGAPNYDINGNIIGSIGIHLDITEQKELEESLYLLSLIAEKNINAVVVTDKEGKIEWVNSSFTNMSGYTIQELMGKKPGYLLQGPETNLETVAYLRENIEKGLPFNCEIINYSKTGDKYWIKIQGQALYSKKGEILKYFAIEEDITNKKELEGQREELVDSLAKSNKELEDYAAIVSHDLKSPLRSIHSLITWIKEDNDKEFNEQTLKYLSMIEGKVEKMDHLIEGILTYAKIDKVDMAQEAVNTNEVVQNIINIIHIPEHISVTISKELPEIKADRFRIQQLFQNIISNAVNYIDKTIGKVEISYVDHHDHYVFSIADNGPGIAKDDQEKIFQIFQSLKTSDKSTGLGLSIVKKIVDSYNGEIWIESEVKLGTTFFIKMNK